jgi:hypothetical protein
VKPRLLHPDRELGPAPPPDPACADLVQDLHVETVVAAMADGDRFLADVSRRVLLASLADPAEIGFRQEILADCVAHPEAVRAFYDVAVAAIEDRKEVWGWIFGSSSSPAVTLSSAIRQLEAAVPRLRQLRALASDHQASFASPGLTRLCAEVISELDDEYFAAVRYHLARLRFRDGYLLSARLDWDNSGKDYALRSPAKGGGRWRRHLGRSGAEVYSFSVHPRDEAGGQALGALTERGINQVADALGRSSDHVAAYFDALRAELGFYVGCLNLRARLEAVGQATCTPAPAPPASRRLDADGLCDAALALRSGGEVVGNRLGADGRPLVVVTGANSGGKSTFLRSVGLAQLMMQSGMFVTARSFSAAVCDGLYTHFIREEDESMESGRFDEELARLSVIVDRLRPGSVVLFNETFAGTNEHEGSEIARQVVAALLEAGVRVLFVTHQFDFADSCGRLWPDTVFLRAERGRDGRPDYRLRVAPPAPTSFGEDLYRTVGGWLGEEPPPATGERAPAEVRALPTRAGPCRMQPPPPAPSRPRRR